MRISKGTALTFSVIIFLLLVVGILLAFPLVSPAETSLAPMNASISQTLAILLSNNLSQGIFFTNVTGSFLGVGAQYPLTEMEKWNNGTGNFIGTSYATVYNVTAPASNTQYMKVCHCVCKNLTCSAGSCAAGTENMWINGPTVDVANEGVEWANATNATLGGQSTPLYEFPTGEGTLTYQTINASMPYGSANSMFLRYWLDPYPDAITSGTYNTTYKFIGVEATQACGACTC